MPDNPQLTGSVHDGAILGLKYHTDGILGAAGAGVEVPSSILFIGSSLSSGCSTSARSVNRNLLSWARPQKAEPAANLTAHHRTDGVRP